jgi:glycosidase
VKLFPPHISRFATVCSAVLISLAMSHCYVRAEAMLQYFNTSWNELAQKMPELAEAGYDSIWIPPPTKAGNGLSVGYDLFDPFDLGSKDQKGSVSTRYGTEADLIRMVETAHRFGIRVYPDNVMNHRGFDVPGYNEFTPVDVYPGMLPEDFHLQVTQEGFYRNWSGISDYSNQNQVWLLSTSNLVDVAQEPNGDHYNDNFGANQFDRHIKIKFVRHPNNPEYYCYKPDGTYVGFGANNGITTQMIAQNQGFYSEYVENYLNRAARWELDRIKADGFRLDAVKHVRPDFFGATYGADKDSSTYGYLGQIEQQFHLSRNFSDINLRDSVFNTEIPRNDAMFFGEHLGGTAQQPYIDAGMRLVDNNLSSTLNGVLSFGPLTGLDQPGGGGLSGGPGISVGYAQSADNGYANKRQLQHAFLLTRAGLSLIYTDGNHQSGTLADIGKAFPAQAYTNFLGQFSDPRIPNLLYIHNQFARGDQIARWSIGDTVCAYERRDKRENSNMTDADGTTMLFMMNCNSASGQSRPITTAFSSGAYLWQYATGAADGGDSMNGFYYTVPANQQVTSTIPKGGYFVFSYRTPEESDMWINNGGKAITILQSGQQPSTLTYTRKDGPDGDPNFNPYAVTGATSGSYSYPFTVPRITNGSNLSFIARADASAEDILMDLDGGMDINSQMGLGEPTNYDKRDNPPGIATDVFLGYEKMQFVARQYGEKFAAMATDPTTADGDRNKFGSAGAETWYTTVGSGSVNTTNGPKNTTDLSTDGGNNVSFFYHDPSKTVPIASPVVRQYVESGTDITIWGKTNTGLDGFRAFIYYTTDGTTYPEGAGGIGLGTTKIVEMFWQGDQTGADAGSWWKGTISPQPSGTLRYKLGAFRQTVGTPPVSVSSVFPSDATSVTRKKRGMTTFQITNFNAANAFIRPHNDYGVSQTGLSQGFHVVRTRQFLKRDGAGVGNGQRSSLYNTTVQTFYYDTQLPSGAVVFPANDGDSVGGQQYGAVVRTDQSVTDVQYKIIDSDPNNDDTATTLANGNNAWVAATQLTANPTVQSPYPNEWRFNYVNIPSSGTAQILVRLRKLSSSTDNTLSDSVGHFTTLTRTVNTNGPTTRIFVAYPQTDGQTVDSNYVMKVWFSKSLADGTTTQQLLDRFVIKIASSESGSATNGVIQDRSKYTINYNVTNDYHELAYHLPNLYNGVPDFLHTIDVIYTPPAPALKLETMRLVKMAPIVVIKDNIVSPSQFNADGSPFQIVLPDVASPTAAQRSYPISIETDATATNVSINFTLGSVNAGDVTLDANNPVVNGNTKVWNFTWANIAQGQFQFTSTVTAPGGSPTATRSGTVLYRQIVDANPAKQDVDDDGLGYYTYDASIGAVPIETTVVPLPSTNSESWTNGQVHLSKISGKTNPLSPDTDGDGMSDGLELGWGSAVGDTNTTTDTNGDGVPNFQPDLDPPIFNTTDNGGAPSGQDYSYFSPWPYNLNNGRTDQIAGTMTDPNKPDTDDDGIMDGVEDRTWNITTNAGVTTYQMIHNGRVDILPNGVEGEAVVAHPPTVYNTSQVDRLKVLAKSSNAIWLETDPNNSDTDGDGLTDGTEDVNQNGIVDLAIIDRNQTDGNGNFVVLATTLDDFKKLVTVQGTAPGAQQVTFRYSDFCYTFVEPTNSLTYTSTALDKAKLNAVFRPGGVIRSDKLDVIWLETDPRRQSTTGDALPDGWKVKYGLDPYDDGVIGHYNLHTGKVITNTDNGSNGTPAGDGISNLTKFINGLDPHVSGTPQPPPPNSITIGPVPNSAAITKGAVTNFKEFTDWTADDLIALDYYDGDGPNYNGADIYHAYDGWDTSRDMVAFYAHDGGDPNTVNPNTGQNGDGNFYFRVDMNDLQALAEQGNLDIYVAINFGNPGVGEYNLPDQIDTGTTMRWQAVVACYQSDNGRVYIDTNPSSNSTAIGQDLTAFGVVSRDQNAVNGFKKAYYSSNLDAVEFSISRQALKDAGWDGLDASKLLYQVYTTKDGTQDSPVGLGDIGGRSDIRDSIRNDWIASDYWQDQANISGAKSVLGAWVSVAKDGSGNYKYDNDRGKRIKVVSIIHGNQAIQPGNVIQSLINNGASAGYYRPLDVHEAYNVPLTLHITPTLASAIQWAAVSPSSSSAHGYVDGPALNQRIATLIGSGLVDLLGSTFSDHVLPYFSKPFNQDNVSLANEYLTAIYNHSPSSKVFWTPERTSSSDVLDKVSNLGYQYTFVDQLRHIFKWFGRTSALDSDAYRINQINGVNCFIINDGISPYLFQNTDNGVPILLRQLLNKRARNSPNDQVVILMNNWEDFGVKANADAYDKNIAWMANHPWIQIVTPDQIANNQIDTSVPPNPGNPSGFGMVSRGTGLSLPIVSKDWIDHATEENYDNWYNGLASTEESLRDKVFQIRTGVPVFVDSNNNGVYDPASDTGNPFGTLTLGTGIVSSAWQQVNNVTIAGASKLARATAHAAVFETAFHDQTANDLSKFSTGAYITPDGPPLKSLSGFARSAQSQMRMAAIYTRVNTWAAAAGNYTLTSFAEQSDVDLDGEKEYMLYNDRVFALFEAIGGRLVGAWVRNVDTIDTNEIQQVVGNFASYSGSETEEEGNVHLGSATGQPAYRTSGFKDWFAQTGGAGVGTNSYVNNYYSPTAVATAVGWTFTSSDTKISKTITLAPRATTLQVQYNLSSPVNTIYVRFGMSPNLGDLLISGQKNLAMLPTATAGNDTVASEFNLFNNSGNQTRTFIRYGGTGLSGAAPNLTAVDRDSGVTFDTINMRNQAQTQQVEISGGNNMVFALGLQTGSTISFSTAHDGIPDWWKIKYFGAGVNLSNPAFGSQFSPAGDGKTNLQKWILGENPTVANYNSIPVRIIRPTPTTATVQFATLLDRVYQLYYKNNLSDPSWTQLGSDINGTGADVLITDPAPPSKRFYRAVISRTQP